MATPNIKDLQELKSLSKPPELVKDIMMATLILLGEQEDWRTARKLLGKSRKESLLTRTQELEISSISSDTAAKARDMIKDVSLDMVLAVSKASSSLYLWVTGVIDEVEKKK